MKTTTLSVKYRRKRTGRTNYRKRLTLLMSGTTRMVIRKSLKHIVAQLVIYEEDGDKVVITVHSKSLQKYGWPHNTGTLPASYLIGIMIGHLAKKQKIERAVLDMGFAPSVRGSRIYAVVRGALDAGLQLSCDEEILPKKDRVNGTHLKQDMAATVKEVKTKILES